jgi:hypothetical protein
LLLRPAVILTSLLWASAARAAGGDYALESKDWNGLGDLASLAAGSGLTLEARSELSWRDIGPGDVLFIVYPTARVDPAKLGSFLRGGGRALIADDFGRADDALAMLRIRRHPRQTLTVKTWDDNPNLPIATASEDHLLSRGVPALVTNHPAAFSVEPGPSSVFGFGEREAVVVAGSLGDGRFVALSDPSLLINDMLAFPGHVQFAVNLLDFLAPARPGRILVVTRDAILTGEPQGPPGDEPGELTVNQALAELVGFLDDLNDYLAPGPVLRMIAVVAGLTVLAIAAILLPLRRARGLDGSFARVPAEPSTWERLVAEYDDGLPEHNFAYPAAVLRENVDAELEARLATLPAAARGPTLRALELCHRLPPRHAALGTAAYVSRRAFIEAQDAVAAARRPG